MNEKKVELVLPRRDINWIRLSIYSIAFLISSMYVVWSLGSLGITIFYSHIINISLVIILSLVSVFSGYNIIDTLYQRPLLVLTPNHIFTGTKRLLRSSWLQNSGITPDSDIKLVIVKETATQHYWLMLEEKKIIDLALFSTIEQAEKNRHQLKQIMSKFYPDVFISTPIYREV